MSAPNLGPAWNPADLDVRLARIEARFEGLEKRLDDMVKFAMWGFGVQTGLLSIVLARLLLK